MATEFSSAEALTAALGQQLPPTEWFLVAQEQVNQFAEATGDHQWIHVDVARAKDGPFGGCIAHGYLTLSMAGSFFLERLVKVNCRMGVNYGLDKVRFPAPVPVGSRIRAIGEIAVIEMVKGGIQATVRVTVEIEGSERPACVADTISRYYF